MNVRIEANEQGSGCTVWLDNNAVSFQNLEDAKTYVCQLQERIEAASRSFFAQGATDFEQA
ncbi:MULTISPECIES: hypothetical protein [Pseudomonas]|uniref:Uncharacterized protein n=1 Tax=Pseudomonas helleri TaxID=1608996 RepID=A0A6L5HSV0_9PSED|nr:MULTISPECIES: hypothetical protein [Pseudomonas]MQT50085.1 hypothetical protein [Pseudomonas helleri]MQT61394.1 hypothetical protein [Pseudomonas sp. FSL R10-0399]MQT92866.1 hypothetical protein [Pseudomonas helleri]MQU06462.1 hypothetical protein [Pseudomonas helleri]